MSTFGQTPYAHRPIDIFRDTSGVLPLIEQCPVLQLKHGQCLAESSQRLPPSMFIVLSGTLEAQASDTPLQHNEWSAQRYTQGECLGVSNVLDQESVLERLVAIEDTEVLALDSGLVWRMVDQCPGFAANLLKHLAFTVRATNVRSRRHRKIGEFYKQLSMVDGLTGLHNRAWLNGQLHFLCSEANVIGQALTAIMVDIDHFKRINDQFGHQAGDHVLTSVANVLSQGLRQNDYAVRYGGEEFLVLLQGSNLNSGSLIAQRLLDRLRQTVIFDDPEHPLPHVTASLGVASLRLGEPGEALLERADALLYQAKGAGRNQVRVENTPAEPVASPLAMTER